VVRLGTILLYLLVPTAASRAGEPLINPGQWKVTSTTTINGVAQPAQAKSRCVTAEQAEDVARTFGPVSGTINSTCAGSEIDLAGKTLIWRLQCRGQLDAEIVGHFEFDSPRHYKATIVSQGWMAGALISNVRSGLEGERLGECP
jgi:uncharacterized protein DUF3617